MNKSAERDFGRSILKAYLLEHETDEHGIPILHDHKPFCIQEVAAQLNWTVPRTRSMLKTLVKKFKGTLVKVKKGIYKFSPS